jgi:hypothetical protein
MVAPPDGTPTMAISLNITGFCAYGSIGHKMTGKTSPILSSYLELVTE